MSSCSVCYANDNLIIDIKNEVIDINEGPFDNDVKILISPELSIQNFSSIREVRYVIRDTVAYDISNVSYKIFKGCKVEIVEQHKDITKIIVNNEYRFINTVDLGNENEIEPDKFYPPTLDIPLSEDLQHYIYDKCIENGVKYCLFLGLCQQESEFGTFGTIDEIQFHVVSATKDYGMCQTNKKYVWPDIKRVFGWNDITILFDPYHSVDAGMYEFSKCVVKYGNTEGAYDAYNRGLEHHGSTENSRAVVRYWNHWKSILGDI